MEESRRDGSEVWRIGDIVVNARARTVKRDAESLDLPRLSLDLLLALADAAPHPVSTEELMERVWRGVVVSPATVAKRVELLRQALSDDSAQPKYVALERGYGYRLVPQPMAVEARELTGQPRSLRRWALALPVLAALALMLWMLLQPDPVVQPRSERSIAVLPFLSLGDDPADQLFADGLTEELGHALARSDQLLVIGRTSSFGVRGADGGARAIGEALGVAHLLEGTVRRSGDRLRVVATLTGTSDGVLRWTEAYDRGMGDVIDIQQDIAQHVAGQLHVNLGTPWERPTDVSEAYTLYLKAISLMEYPFGSDLPRAQSLLEQAVALDPDFARAWAFLAAAHLRREIWNERTYALTPEESLAAMRDAVDRALAADPHDGWAYGVLAAIAWTIEDDIAKAVRLAERHARGVRQTNDLQFMMFNADLSLSLGLLEQARRWESRVLVIDPLCTYCRTRSTMTLNALGRHEEAIIQARLLVQTQPESDIPAWHLGLSQLFAGKFAAAKQTFQAIDNALLRRSGLAMANHSLGSLQEAEAEWQAVRAMDDWDPPPLQLAYVAAWLGKDREALDILDTWTRTRDLRLSVQTAYHSPAFSGLHDTPGWQRFLENIGRDREQIAGISFSPPMPGASTN